MKICFLTDAWTPVWGGGQAHIWEVTQRLRDGYGCQVDILAPNLSGGDQDARAIRIGPGFIFPSLLGRAAFLFFALVWMLTHKYDIYHSHCYAAVLLPIVKLLRPKTKVAYTVHGAGVTLAGGKWLNIPVKLVWTVLLHNYKFDLLTSVAKNTLHGRVSARQFLIIGNGVDTAKFAREKSNKHKKDVKLIWVGRFDPVKGVKYLIDAMALLIKRYPHLVLVLVGGGTEEKAIRQIVRDKGLERNIIFKGLLPANEVPPEYKSSDIFVLPSLSEGLPMTILEAMASGLPVVATDVGDIPVLIEEGTNGYLCRPGDGTSLACALMRALRHKNLTEIGERNYMKVKKLYTWNGIATDYYSAYRQLMS